MQADTFVQILQLLAGAALLLLGRQLFWLFVAIAGFLASFDVVPVLLPGTSQGLVLVLAVLAGIAGAILAVGLQYVAAAVAGFAAASYASVPLIMPLGGHGWIPLVAGAVGAVMMVLLFDWTLIAVSALAGSRAILVLFDLQGGTAVIAWLALAAVGFAVQASRLPGARPPS